MMKRNRMKMIFLLAILALVGCKKDPLVELIGTWEIEGDRGEVTFNEDGTGSSILYDFNFLSDLDLIIFFNPCTEGEQFEFTWVVTNELRDKGDMEIYFKGDSLCGDATSFPRYNFYPFANEMSMGRALLTVDLHRKK